MSYYNPETGKKIKYKGPTFNKLLSEGKSIGRKEKSSTTGRKISAKGWRKVAPKRKDRKFLREQCGDKCFLDPANLAFPVCKACGRTCDCNIDCRGVQAAYIRARQWKHPKIAAKAQKLKEKC